MAELTVSGQFADQTVGHQKTREMISIQKHMHDQMSAAATRKAYQKLLDEILNTTAEHMPSADDDSHDSFSKDLGRLVNRLKGQENAQDIEASSREIVARLVSQWLQVQSHIVRRERELTGIISLLAETAGRLDHSNRSFYENLGQAVQTLEEIGRIDDISVLRRALSDHVSRLKNTVTSQEAVASEALAGMQDTLETAKTTILAMSRLVSSDPLESLPGRRHAEQFIAELTGKACPFSLGVVRVDGLERVARRYGDASAQRVLQQFSARLGDQSSPHVYPYRWAPNAFVIVSDHLSASKLRGELSEFLRQSGAGPFDVDQKSGRTVSLDAPSVVRGIKAGFGAGKVHKLIEGFCQSARGPKAGS